MNSSGPTMHFLSSQNYEEVFSDRFTWIVDDTNAFGATVHTAPEGHFTAKTINGAIFILNPTTGQLILNVIHPSEWDGQRPLGQLAKWKASEEVATLIRSLSVEDQPKQIIATRKGILDPLETLLRNDFPNIVIRGSALKLPFQEFLRIERLGGQIFHASEPQMVLSNLYDNWLESISPSAAFSRLILILRALSVNNERAKMLLKPEDTIVTQPDHIWPSLTVHQWKKVEVGLRDLIVSDYVNKKNVRIQQ